MGIETRRRDSADSPESPQAILACLKPALEEGDPELTALALNDAAAATGLAQDPLTARSDIASVIKMLKALGLELTVEAA